MSDEAYGAFAYAYDQALGERFFRAARRLLTRVLAAHPPRERTHLDVACGTALAMPFFEQRGYRSTGVDLSLPMLEIAKRRSSRLIAGDMRALPLRGRFGCVTCLYDSLNHLQSLPEAFAQVAAVLAKDGLFLFDVNRPEVYPEVWGNDEPFVADGPDFHLEMATKYRHGRAQALVSGWAMVNGERVAIRERREQRAHNEAEIVNALASAGLAPVEMIEFDPYGEGRPVKLFFVSRHL